MGPRAKKISSLFIKGHKSAICLWLKEFKNADPTFQRFSRPWENIFHQHNLGSKFFKFLEECPFDPVRNEKELPTAMINMILSKESYVKGIPIAEHVPDLTSKSDIITISKFFE